MQGGRYDIKVEAPLSRDKDRLVGFAFVDDTNIMIEDLIRTKITIEDVYISLKKDINRWERGLKSIGVSIIPDNLFVYPTFFKQSDQGTYSFWNPEDNDMELTVNKKFGERE